MRARDIMTTRIVTATPDMPVRDVAALLLERHVSGVPVADAQGKMVGMITEADLIHRIAARGKHGRPWWLGLFSSSRNDAVEFVKVHGLRAEDIMTRDVIAVTEDTPVEEIGHILEDRKIRRVPVVRDGKLVGIVARADLLRLLATASPDAPVSSDDQTLRERIMANLEGQSWAHTTFLNVNVSAGIVHLWGLVSSDVERKALKVAIEEVPGVSRVHDRLTQVSFGGYWDGVTVRQTPPG